MREAVPEKPEDSTVQLGAFLGMAPTTYLPVIYALLLAAILFLLLVLPGIVNSGSRLVVESRPGRAAVSVDGVVVGTAGEPVFVEAGARRIGVSKPGFMAQETSLDIRGRLIFSLFVPRRETLEVILIPESVDGLAKRALDEFSRWSFAGEASGQYQFPPIARTLGSDLAALNRATEFDSFVGAAIRHVDSEAQLADLIAGALVAESGSAVPSPLGMAAILRDTSTIAARSPGFVLQLEEILSGLRREAVSQSGWAAAAGDLFADGIDADRISPAGAPGQTRTIGGLRFVEVPAGDGVVGGSIRAERGGDIPYPVSVGPFLVSQAEITVGQYRLFVSEEPEWAPSNRNALRQAGLVDADYLVDWDAGIPADALPVRNVSAHAAEAFAGWLSSRLGGFAARLPTEAEWDYLAALDQPERGVFASASLEGPSFVGASFSGSLGLLGLAGNVWEWTADAFATHSRYHLTDRAVTADATHRVVRGGGWATRANDFTMDDRGSLPPDWCSGAVGFRIVLVEA